VRSAARKIAAGVAVSKLGTAIVSRNELNAAIARASSAAYHPGTLAVKSTAAETAATWRLMGQRVVFTNGCLWPGAARRTNMRLVLISSTPDTLNSFPLLRVKGID
jgi:hypothetical protein